MKRKVIVIDIRKRSNKTEQHLYGATDTNDDLSNIFIASGQSNEEFINTFFHEITHSFIHWYGVKVPAAEEERLARTVGDVVTPLFRKYKGKVNARAV